MGGDFLVEMLGSLEGDLSLVNVFKELQYEILSVHSIMHEFRVAIIGELTLVIACISAMVVVFSVLCLHLTQGSGGIG